MSGAAGNVMQTAGRHLLHRSFSSFIHEDESAGAGDRRIEFCAVGFVVKVSVSHEVLAADLTRFNDRGAPKKTAFGALGDRGPPLDAV